MRWSQYLWTCVIAFVFPIFFCCFAQAQERIYVSPQGNDAWSGKIQAANPAKSDGPFLTIQTALNKVAQLRQDKKERIAPIVILLENGIYSLDKTIKITPSMSGTPKSPTIIKAMPNSQPVISGGKNLEGWKITPQGHWQITLNDVKENKWNFIQLFVDHQRRFRPRVPQNDTFLIKERIKSPSETGRHGDKKFRFNEGELKSSWSNQKDIEVCVFHQWSMSRNLLDRIDETDKTVSVLGSSPSNSSWGQFTTNHRYFVENVKEALSVPGQWYLDRPTGILTYIPKEGETPDKTVVTAPYVNYLMDLTGEGNAPVEHIQFEGLTFADSNWTTPTKGCTSPQAEITVDGTIRLAGARYCQFSECAFRNIGHYAMAFGTACHSCTVQNCVFKDIGAGGIRIGGDIYNTKHWPYESLVIPSLQSLPEEKRITSDIQIVGNTLSHLGRLHPGGIGVWIGHAANNKVLRNEIFDLYYSATSIGWVWGYRKSVTNHNSIMYNHMHKIGQKLLSDMGAVYTLGISPGTKVSHNLIHDVDSFTYGGWGLYTDEGSTDVEMSYNIVYNTKTGSFHQHYGKENKIFNNIFVNSREFQLQRSRTEKHVSFMMERNIVYWENDSPLLGSNWKDDNFVLDHNLYFNPNHKDFKCYGMSFDQWKEKRGKDLHSIVADPLFEDVAKKNFRLKPESPAFKLGFKPITGPFGPARKCPLLDDMPEPPVAFPLPK